MLKIIENTYPPLDGNVWVLWRKEPRNGRIAKIPLTVDGKPARVNDSRTWTSFANAKQALDSSYDKFDGVGVVLNGTGTVFVDIDNCVQNATVNDIARDVLLSFMNDERQFPVYAELSQSGNGIHILTNGTIAENFKNSLLGVEMYGDKRFCAVTGRCFIRTADFPPCNESLDYIYEKFSGRRKGNTAGGIPSQQAPSNEKNRRSDDWIISHAMRSERFQSLFSGDWSQYPTHSDADYALCKLLAFWANNDPTTIDRIFRMSGLFRPKWCREDYRKRTILKAIETNDDTISQFTERKRQEEVRKLVKNYKDL